MQKQNPLLRIWGWGKDEHGSLIFAILSAFVGVVLGTLPYFAAAQIIIGMLAGEKALAFYLPWFSLGLAGYAARTLLYNMALSVRRLFPFLRPSGRRYWRSCRSSLLGRLWICPAGK